MRTLRHEAKAYELIVVGGGMAGVFAAIAAARRGLRTALLQDRPVLGGNGSKEIRVWLHGANGGRNNRFFRETGLAEELRLENLHRNPLGNAELWDTVLLEAVVTQENLDLYLNTAVTGVELADGAKLRSVEAVTLASERQWTFSAPLFADCTGDGTVAYLAGAEFRSGRESESEYGESLAPAEAESYTLGGSILFAMKDAGRPGPFVAPKWVHRV
ncbi:MAG: FAD-dependent oxidoreductase, partial [Actinomycetota bacterium]